MNAKPIHIVFTTIFLPDVVEQLTANLQRHGRTEQVKVWIVGDRKTPVEAAAIAATATAAGLETTYLDIPAQDEWGRRIGEFYGRVPYNNETRRNFGYLCALEAGCELLISIDDDNYPMDEDFVGLHQRSAQQAVTAVLEEPVGFHNICEYLEFTPARPIFPRGFPFDLRQHQNTSASHAAPAGARVGVTAGLWLREPDIDATTWLNGKVTGTAYTGPDRAVLGQQTWTPINTQNTSVVRDLIPAYLCVPMGFDVPGGKIQRYGDIWGGYFLQAVMRGSPYHVAFGRPVVDHRRRPHSYVEDLRQEFWGMILTDWLVQRLRAGRPLEGKQAVDRMDALAAFLRDEAIPELPRWCPAEVENFMRWTADNINAWTKACRLLGT